MSLTEANARKRSGRRARSELLAGAAHFPPAYTIPRKRPVEVAEDSPKLAYTIKAFCEATGLSRTTVYVEIRNNRLLAKRCGTRTLIPAQNAAAYLAALPDARPKTV